VFSPRGREGEHQTEDVNHSGGDEPHADQFIVGSKGIIDNIV
jgi:hypothetical protein